MQLARGALLRLEQLECDAERPPVAQRRDLAQQRRWVIVKPALDLNDEPVGLTGEERQPRGVLIRSGDLPPALQALAG